MDRELEHAADDDGASKDAYGHGHGQDADGGGMEVGRNFRPETGRGRWVERDPYVGRCSIVRMPVSVDVNTCVLFVFFFLIEFALDAVGCWGEVGHAVLTGANAGKAVVVVADE